MNLIKKLLTALRGGVREAGEAVIDANSMRIYEQEIVEAREHIGEAKESLTGVMAKEMQLKREVNASKETITTHEGYARDALKQENEALALEVAGKIAALESELSEQESQLTFFQDQIESLKEQIREGEKAISEHERQLSMVKTTDSVQKATVAISENVAANHSQLNSAKESLERIRKRQQETNDRLTASKALAEEEGDANLTSKLKDAGIVKQNNGEAVLARLKSSS